MIYSDKGEGNLLKLLFYTFSLLDKVKGLGFDVKRLNTEVRWANN